MPAVSSPSPSSAPQSSRRGVAPRTTTRGARVCFQWSFPDLCNHFLVEPAAVLGCAAPPVRNVTPSFLLAIGFDFNPVLALGDDDAGHGAFLLAVLLRILRAGTARDGDDRTDNDGQAQYADHCLLLDGKISQQSRACAELMYDTRHRRPYGAQSAGVWILRSKSVWHVDCHN